MKPLAHAIVITGLLHAVGLFSLPDGVRLALGVIEPGAYTIFSGSAAAALHDRKAWVLLILLLIGLLGYGNDLQGYARLLAPEGIGILGGMLAKTFAQEEDKHYGTNAH